MALFLIAVASFVLKKERVFAEGNDAYQENMVQVILIHGQKPAMLVWLNLSDLLLSLKVMQPCQRQH